MLLLWNQDVVSPVVCVCVCYLTLVHRGGASRHMKNRHTTDPLLLLNSGPTPNLIRNDLVLTPNLILNDLVPLRTWSGMIWSHSEPDPEWSGPTPNLILNDLVLTPNLIRSLSLLNLLFCPETLWLQISAQRRWFVLGESQWFIFIFICQCIYIYFSASAKDLMTNAGVRI